MANVQIKGLRELGLKLAALGEEVSTKICRAATLAAAQPIKARAIQLAPVAPGPYTIRGAVVLPGNIGRNIIIKRIPPAQTNLTSEHIVTVRGKAKSGYASFVGSLQEYGTVKMAPQPFMRPAWAAEKDAALQAMIASLTAGIAKAASK